MNGAGRLPTHATDGNTGAPTSGKGMKHLWWKYSTSAQRVSPPPRLLLVVLLSAQIMFLAIVRLGPSTLVWGAQGTGSSSQDFPALHSIFSRNTNLLSATSMKSEELSEGESKEFSKEESKLAAEAAPALSSTGLGGKSKHVKKQNSAAEKTLEVSVHEETDKTTSVALTIEQKGSVDDQSEGTSDDVKAVSEKEETNDVSHIKQHVGLGDLSKQGESRRSAKERYDELLPSVDDNLLVDFATKQVSLSGADGKLGVAEISSETPNLVIAMKQGEDEEGSTSAGETGHAKTTIRSVKKAKKNGRSRQKHGRSAARIKQVVTKLDEEKSVDSASRSGEQSFREGEAVSVEVSSENLPTTGEVQSLEVQEVRESTTATATVPEEERHIEGLQTNLLEKEGEQGSVHEDLTLVETKAHEEKENPPKTTEVKQNMTSPATITEEELHLEVQEGTTPEKKEAHDTSHEEKAVEELKVHEETSSSGCSYGYVYVYELPSAFNRDILSNCTALSPWHDVCPALSNGGLGESLDEASPLGQTGSWYASNQFTSELVFHNRMLQHACLTDNLDVATAFYVPFYAGLDVGRYLVPGASLESRDGLSNQFMDWLIEQPSWKKSSGLDHFMTVGRNTWDLRRSQDDGWGSGFFNKPAVQNMTRLLLERNPWDVREMAVPYPTNFHPQSDADLVAWQSHLRSLKRNNLFSFAAAPRDNFPDDFRHLLFEQCKQAEQCQSLNCSNEMCNDNQKTMEFFMDSKFCLQPRGDSFTRRSTFDCLLAGSIPVFFWHRSAYMQYEWHLPSDEGSYSVFISRKDVRNGTIIEDVLKGIAPEKVQAMQEAVIELIPRVVYAVSGFALKGKDAFDVAVEGVMRSFKGSKVALYR